MYVDVDKAVAQALSLRLGALEKRVELLEGKASHPQPEEGGSTDFKKVCGGLGYTERQILSHDRKGELQDARYQIARILVRGGLTVREVSRIMRRSCRSIQRMI